MTPYLSLFFGCCLKNKAWFKRRTEKFKRHEKASEMLADELDIVKLVNVLRIGQFLSKVLMNKHQRALVTNFKKYQFSNLDENAKTVADPSDDLNELQWAKYLTEDHRALFKDLSELFSPKDDASDLSLLYEITGYQAETENRKFWDSYGDDFDLKGLRQTNRLRKVKIGLDSQSESRNAIGENHIPHDQSSQINGSSITGLGSPKNGVTAEMTKAEPAQDGGA